MSGPVNEDLGRVGSAAEASFKSASLGAFVNHGALVALDPKFTRASIARPILRNSEKDGYADLPGAQAYDLTVEHLVTDLFDDQYGAWVATSMGELVAADALAGFVSGTTGSVTKTSDSHVYDDIIRVEGADGNIYHVPVKSKTDAPDVATFAFLLPSAANAAPKNASQTGGAAYRDKKDGTVTTFEIHTDDADFTGETWVQAKGAVPAVPFKVIYTPNQLLKIQWAWRAA